MMNRNPPRSSSVVLFFPLLILSLIACHPQFPPAPLPGTFDADVSVSIEVYFTPDQGDEMLQEYLGSINAAQERIEIAVYNLTHEAVTDALLDASAGGVVVRVVTDADNMDGAEVIRLQQAGVQVIAGSEDGLMHNKFTIIDGTELWLGSLNLTYTSVGTDANCVVRMVSEKAARNYQAEFDEMFHDHLFGADSPFNTPFPQWVESGIPMEVYFSPDDGVSARLLRLVNEARTSIDVLAYSFTLDNLGDVLVMAQSRGVTVRIVYDASKAVADSGSEYAFLLSRGMDVRLDGDDGAMHQKTIIVDRSVVVFGSYNFTSAAEKRNDENIFIIHDPGVADDFLDEFNRIYDRATP